MIYRFIHIKKNAGTTVSKFLKRNGVKLLHGDDKDILLNHHASAHSYVDEDSFKICIVRNPYERTVSFYNWIKRLPAYDYSFEEYIKNKETTGRAFNSWKTQCEYMYDDDKLLIDKIFRFETLEADLKSYFGITKKFPHLNRSTFDSYESYYTPKLKEMVYERFKEDFVKLGYSR